MSDSGKESDEENLEMICSKLDSLSIQMLCLMKEYIDCKVNIEDLIKSGSLHLAKSRYIMGNRSVSALQLPTEDGGEVGALTKVVIRKTDNTEETLTMELSRLSVKDDSQVGLKCRTGNDKTGFTGQGKLPPGQDPLKWFGVLVPQNLRHAQSYFNKALDYVVQCANIQLEINAVRGSFDHLIAKKKKLTKTKEDDPQTL